MRNNQAEMRLSGIVVIQSVQYEQVFAGMRHINILTCEIYMSNLISISNTLSKNISLLSTMKIK
jgi:hypothetical protein